MPSPQSLRNLRDLSKRSPEEFKEISRRGALKSSEVRKQKKLERLERQRIADDMDYMLSKVDHTDKYLYPLFSEANVNLKGHKLKITNQMAIVAAQILKAKRGDTHAFTAIRDTIGEKPVENIKTEPTSIIVNVIVADEQTKELMEKI
jgi:hypothetical protein